MHWQAFHKKTSLYLKAYLTKYVITQKRIYRKINRRCWRWLASAGILFLKNHILYHKLIKKEFE